MTATNEEVVDVSSDEWEDCEYEIGNEFASRPVKVAGDVRDIVDTGVMFETEGPSEAEKEELNSTVDHKRTEFYWTREEIRKHLDDNPRPDPNFGENPDCFDDRLKYMEEIVADGVYKKLDRAGHGDLIAVDNAVLYNLNAYLEGQDEPFDSTWLRGRPNLHKLSFDAILPGLCKGLLTMRKGERSEFIVRPQLAYLEMGCPPRVPPNATILYIVEVLNTFKEGSLAHFETLDSEERAKYPLSEVLKLCDAERISGNSYYKAEQWRPAAFRYRRAIRCLEEMTYLSRDHENESKELLLKLYVNIANTYIKFQKPFNAMSNCKKALAIDSKSYKAYYHYGLAKMMNADYKEAKEYLLKAKRLKPKSREIDDALTRLDSRMTTDAQVEKNLYARMGSAFK